MRLQSIILVSFLGLACGGSDERERSELEAIEFSIAQPPIISVGISEGDKSYQLFKVRSAFQLESGGLVIANEGTLDLRFYDARGRHLRTVGRRGQGPGEFGSLWYARAIRGDTVVTWDPGLRRVSFFDEDGDLVDEVTVDLSGHVLEVGGLPSPASPEEMVARWDGLLLFQPGAAFALWDYSSDGTFMPTAVAADGLYQVTHPLFVVDRDGHVVRTVGPVPGSEWFVKDGIRQIRFFGASLYIAAGRETFAVGSGKPYEFSILGAQGDLQLVKTGRPELPLTDVAWEERLQRAMPRGPDPERLQWLRAMPQPETLPAYSALIVDDEDRVWVQEFDAARSGRVVAFTVGVGPDWFGEEGDVQHWSVFDRKGALLGRLTVPWNVRITDVARGHLTAVVHDQFDVERVQVFALQRK